MTNTKREPASFRDPDGLVFYKDQTVFRQIHSSYSLHLRQLFESGLYDTLVSKGYLIPHEKADLSQAYTPQAIALYKPNKIPFISYPYEWSFSQLKTAALLTLKVQQLAIDHGMSLKDASAYNVQFLEGKPIFIDLLSFELLSLNKPWQAYRQFCQHFLAPLALMAKTNINLIKLLSSYLDGVPLSLATTLLPWKTKFGFSLGLHIHFHAFTQQKFSSQKPKVHIKPITANMQKGIIASLHSAVHKLTWKPGNTEWHDYYENNNNYTLLAMQEKESCVSQLLDKCKPRIVWDLGANDGRFSRIAAQKCTFVVSWDIDPSCVENNYRTVLKNQEKNILPLLLDLTNPSPAIGWANFERKSILERGPADTLLALGLIHHLAISNNLPFEMIASYFSKIGTTLIIEFIAKEDSQVQKLISHREDIFSYYTEEHFIQEFKKYFRVEIKYPIKNSARVMYLMKKIVD